MKNIFTKTLTLIAFLSLSIGVWGDPYLSLTFDASDKNDNGQMIDDNYNLTQHGKEWTTSVFYYSKAAEDKIKNNAGFSDRKSHMSLGEASKFRSKNTYHFDAGTYTVVLTAYGRDNSKCDVPDLYIGDNKYTSRDKDYVENIGDGKHQDITYTITTTGGDLYVKGEFIKTTNLSENVGWGELIFTKAGGPTPPTPTTTDYYYHGAKNSWGWDKLTASETNLYAYYGPLQYNGTHEFYIRTAASDTGEKYGCNFTHSGFENTNITNMNSKDSQWDKGDNGNVAIYEGTDNAYYVIIYYPNTDINTDNNPKICASSELPLYTAGGKTIYFDNSTPNWSTCYFRIGRHNHNSATVMTKVSGTANLYKYEVAKYDSYNAFAIANNYSWTGSNSIYTNNNPKFTGSTEYQKYDITTDQTFTLGSTSSSDNVTWYAVEKHDGLLTHNASITAPEGGTITVSYKDINNADQSFTSGDEDLAHTCILTITATPNTGYNLTSLKVNGNAFTSGQTYTLTADAVITAEFACIQRTITVNSEDNDKGTVSGSGTYCHGTEVQISATPATGYEFDKWSDNNTDNPRTITADNDKSYTAYFKKEAKVCNKLMIECETYKSTPEPTSGTKWPSGAEITNDYYTKWTGTGYVDFKGNTGEIYFPVHLPAANYTFEFTIRNGGNRHFNLYQKSNGSGELTIDGVNYAKINGGEKLYNAEWDGNSGNPFVAETKTRNSVTEDDYVIGLYGEGYASFDHILITASSDVFCPATYTVYYEDPSDSQWKDAAIVDGAAQFTLAKDATFDFKIRKTSDGETYTYYGATADNNSYETSGTDWKLDGVDGSGYNVHLKTAARGTYTINVNTSGTYPQINITYPASYTATFNMQGHGSAPAQQTHLATGDKVVAPATPADVSGWHFVGWYKEQTCTTVFDFENETISNSNVTIYAKWISAVKSITIHMEDDTHTELTIGQTNQLYVTYDPDNAEWGKALRATDPWVAQDASTLSVDNTGLVTAKKAGTKRIYAYTVEGISAEYEITVVAPVCTAFYIHYWTSGTSNAGDWCMNKYGEHEWRTDIVQLPSESDDEQLSIGNAGGQVNNCKNWNFNWLPMVGQQSSHCTWDGDNKKAYYAGQDALGYLRLFDNSGEENYFLAFEPIYVAMFGYEGNTFTQVEFSPIATEHTYQSELCKMPDGYKNELKYVYYVGTKRAPGSSKTPFINNGKSRTDALNGVTGLSGEDWGGKYGKFEMYDDNCNANFGCIFLPFYTYELRNDDESRFYLAPGCPKNGGATATTFYSGVPEKTGYTCIGWNTQKGATVAQIVGGSVYNYDSGNDVRYPVWQAIEYNITYNKVEGATNPNPTKYTIEQTITLQPAVLAGYDFGGWYLDAKFTNQITQISAGSHEDKTLYAKWTPTEYSITYNNLEGATNPNPTTYTIESETITLQNPGTRAHYTFNGWFSDDQFGSQVTTIAQGSTGDKVLYAKWTEDSKYTITFDAATNGGTCSTTSKDIYVGEAVGTLPEATRDDYNMTGWFDAATGGNQITESTIPTGNVTYYAQFAVAPLVECTNQKKLECEDAMIPYDKLTIFNSSLAGPETATFGKNDDRGEYSGRGYMLTVNGSDGSQIYIPLSISGEEQATLTMQIRYANSQHDYSKIRIYQESQGSGDIQVTNTGKYYSRISSEEFASSGWTTNFATATYQKTLAPGNYIIGLWAKNDARFDYIDISTANDVLCTTTPRYELKLEINNPTMGENATGAGAYTAGALAPINVTAKSGYEFVAWKKGETLVSTEASFNYTMPAENVTLTAYFDTKVPEHTLTASVAAGQSSWGRVDPTTQQVGEGRPAQVTAIVDDNQYRFDYWSSSDVELTEQQAKANPLNFTMPTKDVAVVAHFVFDEVHNMIATGTSTNIGSKQPYGDGTITMTEQDNASFTHKVLRYDYNISNGDYCGYSLPTDAGYTVNAKATGFAFWFMTNDKVYMEIKADGSGKAFNLPNTNGEWHYIYLEDNAAKTATSFEVWMNYEKGGWSMSNPQGTMYITEIQATNVTSQDPIVPPVNLTVAKNPDDGGTVTTFPKITTGLTKGTEVTLTAAPADNYRFVNWTVGGEEVSKEATYARIVNATETITANFVRVYTLTITDDGNGTATVSPEKDAYAAGDEITVTPVPNSGYKFKAWLDGNDAQESTNDPYVFTMPASDKTLKVTFEESINYYDINTDVSGEGTVTIKVNGETHTGQQILEGTQVTLTATPNDESHGFTQWQDGNHDNPRTIIANETNAAITWTATFAQVYTVSVELGAPGKEVIGVGKYAGGAQVTLTAVAATEDSQGKKYDLEYQLKEWTVTADVVDIAAKKSDNPLTFTMPYQNVSLKATFAPVECTNTKTIQCEDLTACLTENDSKLTLKPFDRCHGGGCQVYNDHYTGFHGEGYWDFKEASDMAMYYPVTLEPGTYSFTVWNTTDNQARGCWMYIYTPSETDVVLTYDGQNFKETARQNVDFYNSKPAYFGVGGTISNIVIPSRQKVFIALYASDLWSAWDQIVITATEHVFCAPLPTTDFVINAGETKEIPVCGVDNLTIYDGGQANNYDDVEVFKQVKYSRTVAALDKWETFAVPYNATSITVQDIPNKDLTEYTINPIYGVEGYYTAGYFYMEELKGEDATLMGRPFASRWEISLTQYPQQNVPYIIRFPREQDNGYFANTQINYKYNYNGAGASGASVILTGKKNATIIEEDYPGIEEKPTFFFYANNTLANIQLETSAYILNESGMNFDIVDQPVIPPFHCYIQATQKIKQMYPHLAMRNDGGGTTILMPLTEEDWKSMQAKKVLIDEVIYIVRDGKLYSIMGQLVK